MSPRSQNTIVASLFIAIAASVVALGQPGAATSPTVGGPGSIPPSPQQLAQQLGMRNAAVHDPSTIVKCKDEYWLFRTGNGDSYHSKDLINWTAGPAVLSAQLSGQHPWIQAEVPAFRGNSFWAPDVIKVKDKYLLFYSASAFGLNTSTIGVETNPTLDPNDPAYKWTDNGKVVTSRQKDDFNCIDPGVILDTDGKLWLSFGSFWSGIKLIELNPDTGKRIAENSPMYSLAHWDSIEASYIYKHDKFYYLFVSIGLCCRGNASTYNTRLGRSEKVTGPYLDKDGKDLLLGGGTEFMTSTGPLVGPGHIGITQISDDPPKFIVSCHYETNGVNRNNTLSVRPLTWENDWPVPGKWPVTP